MQYNPYVLALIRLPFLAIAKEMWCIWSEVVDIRRIDFKNLDVIHGLTCQTERVGLVPTLLL